MAITQSNKGTLVGESSEIQDSPKTSKQTGSKDSDKKIENSDKPKNQGFIKTTLEELKMVEWPSLAYVLKWSLVIIVFTTVFSLFISYVDLVFKSGVEFFDCNSGGETISNCGQDFGQKIILND